MSKIVGWSNFLGFTTGPCSVNYALAAMILAAAQIGNPDYVPETWHLYLTFLFLLIFEGCLTMNSTKFLGYLNILGTIMNVVVLVILCATSTQRLATFLARRMNADYATVLSGFQPHPSTSRSSMTIALSGSTSRTGQNGQQG